LQCEFEEKQYEQPLNYELASKRRIYPAGQRFENKLAIDAAIFSRNPEFWKLWKDVSGFGWRAGLKLTPDLWDNIEQVVNSDLFPKFKFNLFVQHKRPEYISSPSGAEYFFWNQPYFRYNIVDNQQKILHKLERRVSSEAIVVYACPSFWRRADLWRYMNGKLVENSNFVQPTSLQGHGRYTFLKGGNFGGAFSEPREIPSLNILADIDRVFEKDIRFESNTQFLRKLAMTVRAVIKEDSDPETREAFLSIERTIGFPEHEFGNDLVSILTFTYITVTTWAIGYEAREVPHDNSSINGRIKGLFDSL